MDPHSKRDRCDPEDMCSVDVAAFLEIVRHYRLPLADRETHEQILKLFRPPRQFILASPAYRPFVVEGLEGRSGILPVRVDDFAVQNCEQPCLEVAALLPDIAKDREPGLLYDFSGILVRAKPATRGDEEAGSIKLFKRAPSRLVAARGGNQ